MVERPGASNTEVLRDVAGADDERAEDLVSRLVDFLTFDTSGHLLAVAQSRDLDQAIDAFGAFVRRLRTIDRAEAERIASLMSELPPPAMLRVVLAPEALAVVRTAGVPRAATTAALLIEWLAAEAALVGAASVHRPTWTALGDAVVTLDGEITRPLAVEGLFPVDAASPRGSAVDPVTGEPSPDAARAPLGERELEQVAALLTAARSGTEVASRVALDLVRTCTRVAVVRSVPGAQFSGGSSGRYVGRPVLATADWDRISAARMAEAVVHEAIHALLFMLDFGDTLGLEALDVSTPPIISPWTGRRLGVEAFVHACFVWFGLARFWECAAATNAFPAAVVRVRREHARAGYRKGRRESLVASLPAGTPRRVKAAVAALVDVAGG